MGLTFALSKSVRSDRSLKDTDLIAALTSLAKTWRRWSIQGLHYESGDQRFSTCRVGGSAEHDQGISRG
jgi:hypothetical protein